MTREELIYTLLRSEKAPQESNYLTYLDNATDSVYIKESNMQEY